MKYIQSFVKVFKLIIFDALCEVWSYNFLLK